MPHLLEVNLRQLRQIDAGPIILFKQLPALILNTGLRSAM